jgi:hypothetical protein
MSVPRIMIMRSPAVDWDTFGVLSSKTAATIFTEYYLETKISYPEYERWVDLMSGSQIEKLKEFYVAMVKKYVKNYFFLGLLIYLHDLKLKNGDGEKEIQNGASDNK